MPFDGKPESFTKVDTSLAGLIAWLEKQPADGVYEYTSPLSCVMCLWLSDALGQPINHRLPLGTYGPGFSFSDGKTIDLRAIEGGVAGDGHHTFGAALDRARKLAASM